MTNWGLEEPKISRLNQTAEQQNQTRSSMVCRVMLMLVVASCALHCATTTTTLPPCPPGYTTTTTLPPGSSPTTPTPGPTPTPAPGTTPAPGSTTTPAPTAPPPTTPSTTTPPPSTTSPTTLPPTASMKMEVNAVFPQTPYPCIPIEPEASTESGAASVSHVTGLTIGGTLIAVWRLHSC